MKCLLDLVVLDLFLVVDRLLQAHQLFLIAHQQVSGQNLVSKISLSVLLLYFTKLYFYFAYTLLNFFSFQTNLNIYSGKPDISFKFNSGQNINSKRDNLKTKESYVLKILNGITINYCLKNRNI